MNIACFQMLFGWNIVCLDVLEPALSLLKDDRSAARRRAIEVLGAMRLDASNQALHSQLVIEEDFEIRRSIEAAIRPQ
jgi:hypothetical protein